VGLLASWYAALYEIPETTATTTAKCFGPPFIIILNKIKVIIVALDVLERAGMPFRKSYKK